jgi:hypothetical protein
MPKPFDEMEDSNRSANPSIHEVSDPSRRILLRGAAAAALAPWIAAPMAGCASPVGQPSAGAAAASGPLIGFAPVPVGVGDRLVVPEGYVASAIAAWGEPLERGPASPPAPGDLTLGPERDDDVVDHRGVHADVVGEVCRDDRQGLRSQDLRRRLTTTLVGHIDRRDERPTIGQQPRVGPLGDRPKRAGDRLLALGRHRRDPVGASSNRRARRLRDQCHQRRARGRPPSLRPASDSPSPAP